MQNADVTTLSEHESKALLAEHGLVVNREVLAASAEAAATAADGLGYPVAVKLCGRAIAHKTERRLVRLGLGDRSAVSDAAEELLAMATPEDGDVGVLVAEMVRGNRELIAGVSTLDQFGRVVMIGMGGILAEALGDVAFRLLPVEEVDVLEMLDDLDTQTLLGEFRGEPAVDRQAIAAAIAALSSAAEGIDDLVSIDVNPLLIADGRPVAVDALVVTR